MMETSDDYRGMLIKSFVIKNHKEAIVDYYPIYEQWLADDSLDPALKEELIAIRGQAEEIKDRFYQSLHFGTAGLRGKLGAGTNRMNVVTVGRATEGFARMIAEEGEEAKKKGVAIGYDVRHMSREFAHLSAEIFAAHGIRVYLHRDIVPTPVLSYTIRDLGAFAGVMVTASHNPREYNGYKAYGTAGSQILDDWAERIEANIHACEADGQISRMSFEEGVAKGKIVLIDDGLMQRYLDKVLSLTIHDDVDKTIPFVYSPLNGCGNIPIRTVLKRRGFTGMALVAEEIEPDPDFTTTGYPNPERPECFRLAEKKGKEVGAELLIASDPDSDRLALEVRKPDGTYQFFNGNHIGALLTHYIVSEMAATGKLPKDGAVIKSIVTGDIARKITKKYGLALYDVLTGFKNIAAPVNEWDTTKEHTFVFGYEESIGYNHGEFVRDKDAVSSAMLLVEAAAFYKKTQHKTLLDVLHDIYTEYGYYGNKLISIVKEGADGQALIGRIMENFRAKGLVDAGNRTLVRVTDYLKDDTGLPKSNVLKYEFDDECWCAIRPSGTEPKIKLYVYSVAEQEQQADVLCDELAEKITAQMHAVK